jgi:hypothetical protein
MLSERGSEVWDGDEAGPLWDDGPRKFFVVDPVFAGPIPIDNGSADFLPQGKWDIQYHYGYYQSTVIKNTAYWGYEKGSGEMQKMSRYNMKLINQIQTLELYHAVTQTAPGAGPK